MVDLTTPHIAKSIIDKVEKWFWSGQTLVIIPKKATFNQLLYYKKHIPLSFDYVHGFLCTIEVPLKEGIGEKSLAFSLKRLECELCWKGFRIQRRPYFRSRPGLLEDLQVTPDDELAKSIMMNTQLVKLVNEVMPDDLFINLTSENHDPPNGIRWEIRTSKLYLGTKGFSKNVRGIYDILELSSETVMEITKRRKGETPQDNNSKTNDTIPKRELHLKSYIWSEGNKWHIAL